MAAKQMFEPHEIPKIDRPQHTSYSISGQSQVRDNHLMDEFTGNLLDEAELTLDGFDLKQMFEDYQPDQLIQVIGKHGVLWLGEMKIERFLLKREFKGRTTLTTGKQEMHVLDWKKEWMDTLMSQKRYDPSEEEDLVDVEAFVVTIRNAAGVRQNGLLHPLIKRWESNDCPIEVWGLATVRALVSYKWNHWARHYVAIQFGIYCCWVASFISLACTYKLKEEKKSGSDSQAAVLGDSYEQLANTGEHLWDRDEAKDSWTIAHVFLTQLLMLPFLYLFLSRILSRAWHWFNFWDVVDVLTQVLQMICTVLFLSDATFFGFNIILAAETVLLVTKIQFYARAFVAVDSSLLDTLKAVVGSIRMYFIRLILILFSFALALFILVRKSYKECIDLTSIGRSVLMMFALMLGEWEMDRFLSKEDEESDDPQQQQSELGNEMSSAAQENSMIKESEYDRQSKACYWNESYVRHDISRDGSAYRLSYQPNLEVLAILCLLCIYMVIMSILFYHLLIAMIIDSHSRQMEVRKLWVHLSRAEIIDILENALPRRMTGSYAYPYIHVLRVIPRRSPHIDRIWRQVDVTENNLNISMQHLESTLRIIEMDVFSRIEGLSERIRQSLDLTEEAYRRKVYRKMGVSQLRSLSVKSSFKLSSRSSQKLLGNLGD